MDESRAVRIGISLGDIILDLAELRNHTPKRSHALITHIEARLQNVLSELNDEIETSGILKTGTDEDNRDPYTVRGLARAATFARGLQEGLRTEIQGG